MPQAYQIFPKERLILQTWHGDISIDDFREFCLNLLADPLFDPSYDRVADFTQARLRVTFGQINEFSLWLKELPQVLGGRMVVIFHRYDATYGSLRVFQGLIGEYYQDVQFFMQGDRELTHILSHREATTEE